MLHGFVEDYIGDSYCSCGAQYTWIEWDEIEYSDEFDLDECPKCKEPGTFDEYFEDFGEYYE